MIRSFDDILKIAKQKGPRIISVAVAEDEHVLGAVSDAKDMGIADAILVGDIDKIREVANKLSVDLGKFEIIDEKDIAQAARKAVELVSTGKAHIVMKGLLNTSDIMKAVLDKEIGLRTDSVISHVAVFDVDGYDRLFLVTDAAMNLAPTLEEKAKLINNAVLVANALDNKEPKVGVICAVEKVNPKMKATLDADALVKMNEAGEIKGCIVGGPFALDNAISEEAAEIKGVHHPAAGKADILLADDIEAGNVLYKSMAFFAKSKNAGIIVGAKAPIVLTSRADSHEAKLNSIALGVLIASL